MGRRIQHRDRSGLALIVVIWILAPVFMTPRNLLNISNNFSFIALMSRGEILVMISGGIDVGVGSVCALSAVVTMMSMRFFAGTPASLPVSTAMTPGIPSAGPVSMFAISACACGDRTIQA